MFLLRVGAGDGGDQSNGAAHRLERRHVTPGEVAFWEREVPKQ